MLNTLADGLLILWMLGMAMSLTAGGRLHLLLATAVLLTAYGITRHRVP